MRIGFIGTGNMGTAIIKGYLKKNPEVSGNLAAFDADTEKAAQLSRETGIRICADTVELAGCSDIIVLAVKPNTYEAVLGFLSGHFTPDKTVISMAAGISTGYIERFFDHPVKVVRIMPNTPALVNEGMTALCRNKLVSDEEFHQIAELFDSIGKTEAVSETLMDAVTGVSGSSPAYVYMFIEALAEAGIAQGLPERQSYKFAAQSVLGAAKMVLETGIHPNELRDMVCSPGGTTIEAVKALQGNGFREDIFEAVQAAVDKSRRMTK